MTDRFVDSNATGGTYNGNSWTTAYQTLFAATNADAAGDVIYVSSDHAETGANIISGAVSFATAGSATVPNKILCATHTGNTTTGVATTAEVQTSGSNSHITVTGAAYIYGMIFKCGDSTNAARFLPGTPSRKQVYESCGINFVGTGASYLNTSGPTEFRNCTVTFSATGQYIGINFAALLDNVTLAGSTVPTGGAFRNASLVMIQNSDLSAIGTNPLYSTSTLPGLTIFRNCKVAANWVLNTSTLISNERVEAYNLDSGDTIYHLRVADHAGTIADDATIYCSATANQGATPLSWKMVTSSSTPASFPTYYLATPEIVQWNATTGSSKTATVEFIIDSATTLNKNDVWLEFSYQGTSGYTQGVTDTDSKLATWFTTVTECDTSSLTGSDWAGEGGTAKFYKLVSTFTPRQAGYLIARVCLAKPGTTIYVDPWLTVA